MAVHVRPDMHVRVPDECAVVLLGERRVEAVSMETLSIYVASRVM